MQKSKIKVNDWTFEYICRIVPETDYNGNILEFLPQKRYANPKNIPLNKYGKGPFCKFDIDKKFSRKTGVYIILVNDKIRHVGECEDLHQRFYMGYGNISPRNCFKGGQSTNCRVNSKILQCSESKEEIQLYFFETIDKHNIRNLLVKDLQPSWNEI